MIRLVVNCGGSTIKARSSLGQDGAVWTCRTRRRRATTLAERGGHVNHLDGLAQWHGPSPGSGGDLDVLQAKRPAARGLAGGRGPCNLGFGAVTREGFEREGFNTKLAPGAGRCNTHPVGRFATQRLQQEIERHTQFLQPALANTTADGFKRAPKSAHVMPIAAPAYRQTYECRPAIVGIRDPLDIARLFKMIHQRTG